MQKSLVFHYVLCAPLIGNQHPNDCGYPEQKGCPKSAFCSQLIDSHFDRYSSCGWSHMKQQISLLKPLPRLRVESVYVFLWHKCLLGRPHVKQRISFLNPLPRLRLWVCVCVFVSLWHKFRLGNSTHRCHVEKLGHHQALLTCRSLLRRRVRQLSCEHIPFHADAFYSDNNFMQLRFCIIRTKSFRQLCLIDFLSYAK